MLKFVARNYVKIVVGILSTNVETNQKEEAKKKPIRKEKKYLVILVDRYFSNDSVLI